ncbi:MFS transporter [Synechococcus sp. RSCCF101]|uniref:MFS transporter n=1 Tax=Synechococcus sp. RSCCF101 TaxID=2511069 RepID=UPI0012466DE4|nr:MFS transporter [Synechococcus sp. RSCCF101]QEY33435.1 MFS transporter [Synechococcus sp. RSCCF101]
MVGYGLGDAGTGLAATQLGFYLFVFFTSIAGLPAAVAGSLLMVIKVWDGINDPLVGWLSDHTHTRWGPRLPWMLGAALPLGITLAAMWWVPPGDVLHRTAYYVLMAVLLMTAYTSVNLPYAALATELTTDTRTRTRLNAARFTGSILAGISGLVVASLLVANGETGYRQMGQITGLIAATATLSCCWGLAPFARQASRPSGHPEPVRQQLRRILRNGRFLRVLGLYLLLWCALQLMQPVALIYLVEVVNVPGTLSSWILLPFQVSALVGLQLWSLVANRRGRVLALRWGAAIWIVACLIALWVIPMLALEPAAAGTTPGWATVMQGANAPRFLALVATILLMGLGASTAYLIPWSLLPDAIDADPDKPAGLYTAWMVLIQKIGIGLSIQLLGVLLSLSGYRSGESVTGATAQALEQPDSALITIRLCMGLIPSVLVVLGLIVMRRWPDRGAHLQPIAP